MWQTERCGVQDLGINGSVILGSKSPDDVIEDLLVLGVRQTWGVKR